MILAHLKQGSVAVTAGMSVNEGDVLGQVGNSGNTSQPHLHIYAERGGEPEKILNGKGVPIKLGGRFLVRNSLFNGGGQRAHTKAEQSDARERPRRRRF